MRRDVTTFLLRGILLFLLLELFTLPLRETLTGAFRKLIPSPYLAVWECTGFDEVFLLVSFLLALPGDLKKKAKVSIVGTVLLEAFNLLRIYLVVLTGSKLLHDILFRIGGFLLVLLLFYFLGPRYVTSSRR